MRRHYDGGVGGRVMTGPVVAAVVAGVFTLVSVGLTVRLWHDPSRVRRAIVAYTWLPFGENVKRGLIRGAATRIPVLAGATGICVLAATSAGALKAPGPAGAVAIVLIALVILSFLVAISILLVNRPRWLVPPHMRDEPGLLGRPER